MHGSHRPSHAHACAESGGGGAFRDPAAAVSSSHRAPRRPRRRDVAAQSSGRAPASAAGRPPRHPSSGRRRNGHHRGARATGRPTLQLAPHSNCRSNCRTTTTLKLWEMANSAAPLAAGKLSTAPARLGLEAPGAVDPALPDRTRRACTGRNMQDRKGGRADADGFNTFQPAVGPKPSATVTVKAVGLCRRLAVSVARAPGDRPVNAHGGLAALAPGVFLGLLQGLVRPVCCCVLVWPWTSALAVIAVIFPP